MCSSAFPERCNVQANSLYRCTQGGTPVLDVKGDYKKYCAFGMGGSEFIDNTCECKDDGVICGDRFPPKCFLKSGSLYTCTKGSLPVVSKDCSPNKCGKVEIPLAGSAPLADVCLDACLCPAKRSVCFSHYTCPIAPSQLLYKMNIRLLNICLPALLSFSYVDLWNNIPKAMQLQGKHLVRLRWSRRYSKGARGLLSRLHCLSSSRQLFQGDMYLHYFWHSARLRV